MGVTSVFLKLLVCALCFFLSHFYVEAYYTTHDSSATRAVRYAQATYHPSPIQADTISLRPDELQRVAEFRLSPASVLLCKQWAREQYIIRNRNQKSRTQPRLGSSESSVVLKIRNQIGIDIYDNDSSSDLLARQVCKPLLMKRKKNNYDDYYDDEDGPSGARYQDSRSSIQPTQYLNRLGRRKESERPSNRRYNNDASWSYDEYENEFDAYGSPRYHRPHHSLYEPITDDPDTLLNKWLGDSGLYVPLQGTVSTAQFFARYEAIANAVHRTPTLLKTAYAGYMSNDGNNLDSFREFQILDPSPPGNMISVGTLQARNHALVTIAHMDLYLAARIPIDQQAINPGPFSYQIAAEPDLIGKYGGAYPGGNIPSFTYEVGTSGQITRVTGVVVRGFGTGVTAQPKVIVKALFNYGTNKSPLGSNLPASNIVDNGHIVAASLGGSNSDVKNFFPQENHANNAGEYKHAEDAVRDKELTALLPGCVRIEITFTYNAGTFFIPDGGTYIGQYNDRVECFGISPATGVDTWTHITDTAAANNIGTSPWNVRNPLVNLVIQKGNEPVNLELRAGATSGFITLTPSANTYTALSITVAAVDDLHNAVVIGAAVNPLVWGANQNMAKTFTVTAPLVVGRIITISYTLNAPDHQYGPIPDTVITVIP